ncbi:hypothetical protein HDV03_002045 [Kappamyces sp. JEL0829]|nr:hypothetical protein HDV03_002045 [Kappamyces sp. JEL0829]
MNSVQLKTRVLEYWFKGLYPNQLHQTLDIVKFWFLSNEKTDQEIKTKFADSLTNFKSLQKEMMEEPDSALALILLLDQFPRNIYRNHPNAFAFDADARSVATHCIERGFDYQIPVAARLFMYLPFEHSESMAHQQQSLDLISKLAKDIPPEMASFGEFSLAAAQEHLDIIKEFGRFPYRNQVLGRTSTERELQFLHAKGGSMFGVGQKN